MKKNILGLSCISALLLIGCGTDSSKTQQFDVSYNLDKGNYQAVIDTLGDCSSYTGDEKNACLTNLGAAYFGKAGFDTISLAQELTSLTEDEKDKEFNKIVFEKLLDENTKSGVNAFTQIIESNNNLTDAVCTEANFDKETGAYKGEEYKSLRNACYSISPILLSESLDYENNTSTSSTSATLNDVIAFKDVLKDAAPELNSEDLVNIINDENISANDDANNNNELDKVEATSCAIEAYGSGSFDGSVCADDSVTLTQLSTNVFSSSTDTNYHDIHSIKVDIGSNTFYRQIKDISGTYTAVSVDTKSKVDETASTLSDNTLALNGTTVLNKPLLENGSIKTLNDSILSTLNDEETFEKIALLTNAEDDSSDSLKVESLQKDICDQNNNNDLYDDGLCTLGANGPVYTQEAVFAYMNK